MLLVTSMTGAIKRRARCFGGFFISLVLLWQVLAVVHLASNTHTFCPEHGAVAHADEKTGQLEHHGDTPFPSGDSCYVLVALATAGWLPVAEVPIAHEVLVVVAPPSDFPREQVAARIQRHLYRLAPSQSPPVPT